MPYAKSYTCLQNKRHVVCSPCDLPSCPLFLPYNIFDNGYLGFGVAVPLFDGLYSTVSRMKLLYLYVFYGYIYLFYLNMLHCC